MSETADISRPLSSHLEELRSYLMTPFICNMILLVLLIPYSIQLIGDLLSIANLRLGDLASYSPTELLRLKIYMSLIGSLLLAFPLWFRGFYNFSSPGLTRKERKGIMVSFSIGSALFVTGSLAGLFYVSPGVMEIFLTDEIVVAKLSVYETTKLVISISLFCGILASLPVLTLFAIDYTEKSKDVRKYIYFLIILIAVLGTPEPSMIINLIFLVFFATIVEAIILTTGEST
ncbi:MAG: twin-arginine translocase subunit TatC [Candidatus Thermoplasmatota archaeon]|nr:twin-arginine translocase subunit TatC [Candidatus Thermoplasmatota archaeon]